MENDLVASYRLVNDIDCAGVTDFRPIGLGGMAYAPFEGHFDGQGYVVRNLTIDRPSENAVALFGVTWAALIERVGLENVNIHGAMGVGSIAGAADGTTIRQVYVTGLVAGELVGGLVGWLKHGSTLSDSYVLAAVDWSDHGGLLADMVYYDTVIERSYAAAQTYASGTLTDGHLYADMGEQSQAVASFFDCDIAGGCSEPGAASTADLHSQSFLSGAGWDFVTDWAMPGSGGLPCLRGMGSCGAPSGCGDGVLGAGEVCDPGLDAGCKPDCTGPITNATTEISCRDGADNDSDGLVDCADFAECASSADCRLSDGQSCSSDVACAIGLACVAGACRSPACENGVRDPVETGLDCGGTCAACNGVTCSRECRSGQTVVPPPSATLALGSGEFSRSTHASFVTSAGTLLYAQADEPRFIVIDGRRMLLVEGQSENLLRHSESPNNTDAWTPDPTWPFSIESAVVDPRGGTSAERLRSPAGGGEGPVQSASSGDVATTFSAWLRQEPDSVGGTERTPVLARIAPSSGGAGILQPWTFADAWTRSETTIAGSGAPTSYSLSTTLDPEERSSVTPAPFAVWGLQAEALPFASSYIPTTTSTSIRGADVLVFSAGAVPSWVRSGHWYFEVAPFFSSEEFVQASRRVLLSFGTGSELALTGGSAPSVELTAAGATVLSRALSWERGDRLTFELDFSAGVFRVSGALTGNGQSSLSGVSSWGSGAAMRIGGRLSGSDEAFAAFSDLRQIAQSSESCTPSAACQNVACGNGVLDSGEACDPALNPRCSSSCVEASLQGCESDGDCVLGQTCGIGAGVAFDLQVDNVCRPVGCDSPGTGLACGDATQPCGACACIPSCDGAPCGVATPDGCGGVCLQTCAPLAPNCHQDADCSAGYSCGIAVGPLFGLAFGTNVCWPSSCNEESLQLDQCGTTAAPCGECPILPNRCEDRDCGTDQYGNPCGECASGELCDGTGHCAEPVTRKQPPAEVAPEIEEPPQGAPGALAASANVSVYGTATYQVPLHVPPGRAGLTPQLSLSYNSSGGPGPFGQGWSLGGLSSIARCGRTVAQEGRMRGVQADADDRFCLDGKRLKVIGEDEYGADGSRYVLQFDDLHTLVSHGNPFANSQGTYSGPWY